MNNVELHNNFMGAPLLAFTSLVLFGGGFLVIDAVRNSIWPKWTAYVLTPILWAMAAEIARQLF